MAAETAIRSRFIYRCARSSAGSGRSVRCWNCSSTRIAAARLKWTLLSRPGSSEQRSRKIRGSAGARACSERVPPAGYPARVGGRSPRRPSALLRRKALLCRCDDHCVGAETEEPVGGDGPLVTEVELDDRSGAGVELHVPDLPERGARVVEDQLADGLQVLGRRSGLRLVPRRPEAIRAGYDDRVGSELAVFPGDKGRIAFDLLQPKGRDG